MASENRHDTDSLAQLNLLSEQVRKYDFYAALRLLETTFPDKPRLGESLVPGEDSIRLGQEPSLLFASSMLESFKLDKDGQWHLRVLFYGLFGPNGALPLHLTDYVLDRKRNARDTSMVDFVDLFHHRLLSLFYRAWANKEPTVQYDRPDEDRFRRYIGSLFGIGTAVLQHRDLMPDTNKMHFAAHFGGQTHHVSGLLAVLSGSLYVPVAIEEFVGEWLKIPEEDVSRLGQSAFGQLGVDAVLGGHSWQRQYKFRLHLGPMKLAEYEKFLPGGESLQLMATTIRNYLGDALNWDVRLILDKSEVPTTRLGDYGCLGQTSWLLSQTPQHDVDYLLVSKDTLII